MRFKDTLNHNLHTCTASQWKGYFRLASIVCSKHWHGLLSSESPTSVGYLSILRENVFRKSVTLINISETDDSGADYLKE